MGTTKIKASLDRNVIHGEYIRRIDVGENPDPVDITVKLLHQYITPNETLKELELQSFEVPASFLDTSNGLFGTTTFEQNAIVTIANPSYLIDLFLEILEVRDTVAVTTRVPVLDTTEEARELTPQPIKYDEFEENIPASLAVYPEDNISTPEPIVESVLYTLSNDDILLSQGSHRVYFEPPDGTNSADDGTFIPLEYNEKSDVIYIENSISNFMPNPQFVADPDETSRPENYIIEAPGLVATSNLTEGDIEGTYEWRIRASNVNPFSAFDNLNIEIIDPVPLQAGIRALTISVYHKLASDTGILSFTDFNININFFNVVGDLLSTETTTTPAEQISVWAPLYGTVQSSEIPLTAATFDVEIEIPGIDATDTFQLDLYLPQAEAMPYFTTRALPDRIHDLYLTTKQVELKLPLYFQLKTTHIRGPGRRGLVSTTTNQKDGFQFLASSDRLRFLVFDVNGVCLFNVGSDQISTPEGDVVLYGLYLDGTNIEFYIDNVLISTHAQTHTIDQTIDVTVGSLEAANSTINAKLEDFKILRNKP